MDAVQTPRGLHLTNLRRKSHISYSSMSIVFSLGWLCGRDKSVRGVPLFYNPDISVCVSKLIFISIWIVILMFFNDLEIHNLSAPFSPEHGWCIDDDCATARFRVRSNRESIPRDRTANIDLGLPLPRPNSQQTLLARSRPQRPLFYLVCAWVVDPSWIEQGSTWDQFAGGVNRTTVLCLWNATTPSSW